ncbi:IS30 family transposase [Demequina sp. NBRC 110051]|uniref:IS30 family transposase n=1 Tax=Demequina sp. NBRC 110051 TaxID=1570340 RepID=UPI0009FF8BA6|nr:IS30 family transposase [Demequina sp. NBRC 110051]
MARYPQSVRDEFVDLVCGGTAARVAIGKVGASMSSHASVWKWWRDAGGVKLGNGRSHAVADPVVDWEEKFGRSLTIDERVEIQAGLRQGCTQRQIAARIGRSQSVVCREIGRNRGPDGQYYATVAHTRAHHNRRRPKQPKLEKNPELCRRIEAWMDDGWSPKLIADMLARDAPDDHTCRVSHETIYRALYVQSRGVLRQDLARQLSTSRTHRKHRGTSPRGLKATYKDALKISERPAEVADRAVPGHWEGDLIKGADGRSQVGTLVERSTRFVILLHLPERATADVVAAEMIAQMSQLPSHLRRSITWDRGAELAAYDTVQLDLQAPVYFADPHSPWQRGSNENTNRLLRHWLTKGTDLSGYSADDLAIIAAKLNSRPRPTLDYRTPAQALNDLLATP